VEVLGALQSIRTAEESTSINRSLFLMRELLDLDFAEVGQFVPAILVGRGHPLQRLCDLDKGPNFLLHDCRRIVLMLVEGHAILLVKLLFVVDQALKVLPWRDDHVL